MKNNQDKPRTAKRQTKIKPKIAQANRDQTKNSQNKSWFNQEQGKWEVYPQM